MAAENQDPDPLSDAIRDFLIRETPQAEQPPLPENNEPDDQFQDAQNNPPQPPPNTDLYLFTHEEVDLELTKATAVPSNVARIFSLNLDQLELQRKNKIFTVDAAKDKFKPTLKPGRPYTVIKKETAGASTPNAPPRRGHRNVDQECTIAVNNERVKMPSGAITRKKITQIAPQNAQNIRLIDEDGSILNTTQLNLNVGATYCLIYTGQKVLESGEAQEDANQLPVTSLCRPMSFMAPFIVGVVRIFYALSRTGNAVKLTPGKKTKNDGATPEGGKLICPNSLSTGAYQVAFRLNEAAKVIQSTVSRISIKAYKRSLPNLELTDTTNGDCEDDDGHDFFEDVNNMESPLADVANIIEHLQKGLTEIDELINVVSKQMRAVNPTVESVKAALKAEENQEKRQKQHDKMIPKKYGNPEKLNELKLIYQQISENDERICPRNEGIGLPAITANRRYLNSANELVEKILCEPESESVLADIQDLASFCAKVIHYNLMHWMFAYELIKVLELELKNPPTSPDAFEHKINVAKQIYRCAKVWNTVSMAVPFFINLDGGESQQDASETWNEMKDKIFTSQYALEICYATASEIDDEKSTRRNVGFI